MTSKDEKQQLIEHNEKEFEIVKLEQYHNYLAVKVLFPNCPNGLKIMVYKTPVYNASIAKGELNPHFGRDNSPIARYEPTNKGWSMAVAEAARLHVLVGSKLPKSV